MAITSCTFLTLSIRTTYTGSFRGVSLHPQSDQLYPSEELPTESKVSVVWMSVLLLYARTVARASALSRQKGKFNNGTL